MRRQGRGSDRLVDGVEPVDSVGVDDREPRNFSEQIDPSSERRRAAQMRAGETLGKLKRRVILADVAVLQARRQNTRRARRRQCEPALAGQGVALLEREAVNPDRVRENGALSLLDWRWAEFHAAALSARSGFLRSEATISPMIETAISAGLTAPISSPIGAWMRASAASSKPRARMRSIRLACVFREPSAPM